MRRLATAAGSVVVLAIGAAAVQAAIPDGDGNIYACYDKTGNVRVIDEDVQGTACPKGWSSLKWPGRPEPAPQTTTYSDERSVTLNPLESRRFDLACDAGDIAVGGGYSAPDGMSVLESRPTGSGGERPTPTAWQFVVKNPAPDHFGVIVYVVCQHTR